MGIWGHPWHGRVAGGVLTLPNATTRAYPQPASAYPGTGSAWRDLPGAVHRAKRPGIAAVARSVEQLAADAAAGLEWRNEALLSGARFQLYATPLDGWIWFDADGVRWLVDCPALHDAAVDFSTGISTTLTLRRFGEFGKPAETHAYALSLADLGQGGGDVYLQSGSGSAAVVTAGHARVDAIKPDGSAALLMLHVRRANLNFPSAPATTDLDPMIRWPLGWLELTLSGSGASATVGLAVARSRAQTLSMTRDAVPTVTERVSGMRYTGSAWETYDAARDPEDTAQQTLIDNADAVIVRVWEGAWGYVATRLLALWYTAAGAIEEVALRVTWDGEVSYPAATVTEWRVERASSVDASWTIELLRGGATVDSVTGSYATTDAPWIEWTVDGSTNAVSGTSSGDYDETVTHLTDSHTATRNRVSLDGSIFWASVPRGLGISDSQNGIPRGLSWGEIDVAPELVDASRFFNYLASIPAWRVDMGNGTYTGEIARQSVQVVGMRIHHKPAAGSETWDYRPAAVPGGAYGSTTTRSFVAGGEALHASHNPYDGSTTWLNAGPVCWV